MVPPAPATLFVVVQGPTQRQLFNPLPGASVLLPNHSDDALRLFAELISY